VTFRYFAYGSNLWVPHMRSRCPSATPVATATIRGWQVTYDKPSGDGSAKLNIRRDPGAAAPGVIYDIEEGERPALDAAEPGYTPLIVTVDGQSVLTYSFEGKPHPGLPYDWYVATAVLGASSHGLDTMHLEVDSDPDPIAAGVRPADRDDLNLIHSILSDGLRAEDGRHYIHPGDYAWWVHHDDPRFPDHLSIWIRGEAGFVSIDTRGGGGGEIGAFTRPGVDRMPLIRWSQRRLRGTGKIGWVADADQELVDQLERDGYEPAYATRCYRWDLARGRIPQADLPAGWTLRATAGEDEANSRRAASHAAFESTMPPAMHLQRYLDFMRSPVYVPEHDLIAVTPQGRVASFMVWWADPSGVAQIEPFGTHPDFQRQGVGRALIYHGLAEMRAAGMHTARVSTDAAGHATSFYEGVGFQEAGTIRWWKRSD
jgi:ribosomal protein S18 acetylase RimI-like enzyme